MTADPLGFVDGPSQYAFAGNDPFNKTDPLGLYEEDVHDFLTRYLAEAAGFDKKTAEEIGIATFALDLDGRSAIVGGRAQHDNMDRFHFVSWQQLGVLGDIAFQGKRYGGPRVQLDQDKVERIGEYIHALQDTYAHQKGETYRRFGDYYTGGFLNIGHGLQGHRPDWTWERPELAMQMARDVYGELVALCQRYSSFCHPKPFPQLMSQIDLFIRSEPALYREYVHLGAGHHAVVDDVVDYTAKIQLLDASYQPTPKRGQHDPLEWRRRGASRDDRRLSLIARGCGFDG